MRKLSKPFFVLSAFSLVLVSLVATADVGPMYVGSTPTENNFVLATAANATYPLVQKAAYARLVNDLTVKCASGTILASLAIDGTDITGCTLKSGSSSEASYTCSSNGYVNAGQTLSLVTENNSTCLGLAVTVNQTR